MIRNGPGQSYRSAVLMGLEIAAAGSHPVS